MNNPTIKREYLELKNKKDKMLLITKNQQVVDQSYSDVYELININLLRT